MTCFSLYNRQQKPVDTADVILNGEKLSHADGGRYCIEHIPPPPYHLSIRHPDYLDSEYAGLHQLDEELYLMRRDEDYYYRSFFKVPCLRTRHLLVTSVRRADATGGSVSPAGAREMLAELLERMGMRVVVDYGERFRDEPRPKGIDTRGKWEYIYLVGRTDGREFPEENDELAELRQSEGVAFAGPALVADEHLANPVSYQPWLKIQLPAGIEPQQGERMLSSIGNGRAVTSARSGIVTYTLMLPPGVGMGINRLVEQLHERDDVIGVRPELWWPR